MIYTEKIDMLHNFDTYHSVRLDGRETESPLKAFKFIHTVKKLLKKGDSIEIGRIDRGSIIQFVMENNFKGVKFSVGVSSGNSDCLVKNSNKKEISKLLAPYQASSSSVYLTVTDGEIEIGEYLKGAIVFC